MATTYPLEVMSIGEHSYILISRGHHDIHEFMAEVRKEYSWPLGEPQHIHMKTVPAPKDSGYSCWYHPVPAGTRGAWPCTHVSEAYGDDCYEAKFKAEGAK